MVRASIKRGLWNRAAFWALAALMYAILILAIPEDLSAINTNTSDPDVTEYEVKAAYIFYFAKFVKWPESAFPAQNTPVTIGIIGDVEFGALLENIVKNKTIQEHPIAVRHLKWSANLQTCHMVYISSSEQKHYKQITESLQGCSVLTVTEAEVDSRAKGIMNFFVEGGKVQFEVDVSGAEKAHLHVSSKLLRLAQGSVGALEGKGE